VVLLSVLILPFIFKKVVSEFKSFAYLLSVALLLFTLFFFRQLWVDGPYVNPAGEEERPF
jgi:amino acid permease